MARPRKCRHISFLPNVRYFKPRGVPMRFLEEISLSFEEIEAIRLKDLEGLEQKEAASQMKISRPTFQRILASARNKIATAILSAKAIKIEGGSYKITGSEFSPNTEKYVDSIRLGTGDED
ncbi:MAG: DUF134 domain-containing protein [Dehalococcoidales bacterium]|nr:DUF134 domain-containing protein [Dehalococcoidales bacterium]